MDRKVSKKKTRANGRCSSEQFIIETVRRNCLHSLRFFIGRNEFCAATHKHGRSMKSQIIMDYRNVAKIQKEKEKMQTSLVSWLSCSACMPNATINSTANGKIKWWHAFYSESRLLWMQLCWSLFLKTIAFTFSIHSSWVFSPYEIKSESLKS